MLEAEGCRTSGCVCCIFTVAFGSAPFAPSAGRVMRAVSFFGAAAFMACTPLAPGAPGGLIALAAGTPGGFAPDGGAAGFIGTVGLPKIGGFGGGVRPLKGRADGCGAPTALGGFGGGGTNGLAALEAGAGGVGAAGASAPGDSDTILVVSFFGVIPGAGLLPGRLIRTVSRFAVGVSGFAGKVIRIVSALAASSADSEEKGRSSAIRWRFAG